MNKKIGKMIVTMFGVGRIKYFPGTFASLITASMYYIFYTIKINYFLTIIIFIMSLFIFTSILSISGISFENSFKLSILTLMNTVNSSIYGITDFDFNNLHFLTKCCFILFMIIGRIELLTILLILKKFLFKN